MYLCCHFKGSSSVPRWGCLKAATVEFHAGRVLGWYHLHNDDDNILTGSAARPAAISIARLLSWSEDSSRPLNCVIPEEVGRFVQLVGHIWIATEPVTLPHLGSIAPPATRTPSPAFSCTIPTLLSCQFLYQKSNRQYKLFYSFNNIQLKFLFKIKRPPINWSFLLM